MVTEPASSLSVERIDALRDQASREARAQGGMVDPRRMNQIGSRLAARDRNWTAAILGRPYGGLRSLSWREMLLLDLACDAEPNPPMPLARLAHEEAERQTEAERRDREEAQRQATIEAWESLRAKLPVPASVAFNYSRHTYEFHHHGGDHIVVWDALDAGRLHRITGQALCETPSNTRLLHLDNSRLEREAQESGREQRPPTCKACLRTAERLASAA